jgi:hypothetical protein
LLLWRWQTKAGPTADAGGFVSCHKMLVADALNS